MIKTHSIRVSYRLSPDHESAGFSIDFVPLAVDQPRNQYGIAVNRDVEIDDILAVLARDLERLLNKHFIVDQSTLKHPPRINN